MRKTFFFCSLFLKMFFRNQLCEFSSREECGIFRSRQEFSNDYLVATIGFDTAENEPEIPLKKRILKMIKKINKKNIPVLLMGDFNLTPETKPIKTLKRRFSDVMGPTDFNESLNGTFTGFNIHENAKRRIDYIFEKGFKVFDAKHLLIKTPNGLWASDHHPVYLHCSL